MLAQVLARAERGARNRPQPDAVSITQASEYGTVYDRDELAAIRACARAAGIRFHMDGARFANALATSGCTAAETTWRSGVDILSFGATKNGGMGAEAVVVFDSELVEPLFYRLRRAGQTWSKMRFAAAQLMAYVEDGLFVRLAAHANALAAQLGRGLAALTDAPDRAGAGQPRVRRHARGRHQVAGGCRHPLRPARRQRHSPGNPLRRNRGGGRSAYCPRAAGAALTGSHFFAIRHTTV